MSKLTHKQRISQIYPARPEDRTPNSTHLSSFVYYAQSRPAKLSKVVPYLEHVILKDKEANKTESILVGVEILNALAKECGQHLNFFVEPLLSALSELLASGNHRYVEAASVTFSIFSKSNAEQTYCNPTNLPTYKKCVELFVKYSKDTTNLHVRKAGIDGVRSVILDQNMSRLDTETTLKKLLPAIFDAIQPLPQYPPQLTKEILTSLLTDECTAIAVRCLQETVTRSSIFSLQWTVQALFSWLDSASKWTEGESTLFYFQVIMLSLLPEYYHALVSEVLSCIDAYKGTSLAVKTSMVRVLSSIITVARDSVGVSILELLDSLLTRLVGSLDLAKDEQSEEQHLHQAIVDSIEMLLSKVTLSTVRNECIDFILKRLGAETVAVQKAVQGEDADRRCAVLRGSFVRILDKLSRSKVPLEPSLSAYPTLANRHLLQLLRGKDASVRVAVHAVFQHLLEQALPADITEPQDAVLSAEARGFLDAHFGLKFHHELLAACTADTAVPADVHAMHKTLLSLTQHFAPDELVYLVPLALLLQETSKADEPKDRAAQNLALQSLLSAAEHLRAKELSAYLRKLKDERVAGGQWAAGLDFGPDDAAELRGKSFKDLKEKKKERAPVKALLQRDKVVSLLLQDRPALKPFQAALQAPLVDAGEGGSTEDSYSDSDDTEAVTRRTMSKESERRRQSAPAQEPSAVMPDLTLEPASLKVLLRDSSEHRFDSISYIKLDTQQSVVEFLDSCLGGHEETSIEDVIALPDKGALSFPVFEVS